MTGGSSASSENFVVRLPIDPVIMRALEMLGNGSNLGEKLTDILNLLLTDRLEDINARILECQAEDLKRDEEDEEERDRDEDKSTEVSKRSVAVQTQLLAIRQLLSSYKMDVSEKQENNQTISEITLNLAQFAALQTLGNKKTRGIDLDLGLLLQDLGNDKLIHLKTRLAKELAETGAQPTEVDKPNPDLLQQKEFLTVLGELDSQIDNMLKKSRRLCIVQEGFKILTEACANILQVPASEVRDTAEGLMQKEISQADAQSYQVIYDTFKENVKNFDEVAQKVSLERKPTVQLGKSEIPKLLKEKARKKATSSRFDTPKKELPRPELPSQIEISNIAILDNLTFEPISIRDLIAKMHIVDMSEARFLQIQLRILEKNNQIKVTTIRGRTCYYKS